MLTKYRNKFEFFGLIVSVETNYCEIQDKLNKDFSYFKSDFLRDDVFLRIRVFKVRPPFEKVPKKKETFDRKYSKTIDDKKIRYNKYGEKALTIMDYEKESVDIYSFDENILHELSYLVILSRIGKKMDLMGLHRIHGMAFRVGTVDAIFMMNMGGGKSTLLSHLLNYSDVELISDDTPIVDQNSRVIPFPLRLGAYPEIIKNVINREENIYTLMRQEFGEKTLISIEGINNKVASKTLNTKQIYFQGKRIASAESRIYQASLVQKIYYLMYNMVIGFGLPMIFEYFWEIGIKDFFLKTKIAIYRLICMCKIIYKNDIYIYETGDDPELNGKILYNFIKEK